MIADRDLEKGLLTMKIIWFAILMSLVLYLFVGLYAGPEVNVSMNAKDFHLLRIVLYSIAGIMLFATGHIRRLVLAGKDEAEGETRTSQHPVFQKYTTAMIVSLALSEAVGIFGLVLFFIGKNEMDLYLLLAVSAVAIYIYRPKIEELKRMARGPGAGTV